MDLSFLPIAFGWLKILIFNESYQIRCQNVELEVRHVDLKMGVSTVFLRPGDLGPLRGDLATSYFYKNELRPLKPFSTMWKRPIFHDLATSRPEFRRPCYLGGPPVDTPENAYLNFEMQFMLSNGDSYACYLTDLRRGHCILSSTFWYRYRPICAQHWQIRVYIGNWGSRRRGSLLTKFLDY